MCLGCDYIVDTPSRKIPRRFFEKAEVMGQHSASYATKVWAKLRDQQKVEWQLCDGSVVFNDASSFPMYDSSVLDLFRGVGPISRVLATAD